MTYSSTPNSPLRLGDLLEGQTASHIVIAADDLGWWDQLLGGARAIVPATGLQRSLAQALSRIGWLEPAAEGAPGYRLTAEGREIAFNRGFVRVTTLGWEPTFRALGAEAAGADRISARTAPGEVAAGCTEIAHRHPETIKAIAARIAVDEAPGTTIDLGCADGGRMQVIGELAPRESLVGVDIEAGVIEAARRRLAGTALAERFRLRSGSVLPGGPGAGLPEWLDDGVRRDVTTAMTFFLLHQLATERGGIDRVLAGWGEWFPNLRRLVIGDVVRASGRHWHEQPWFAPTFEFYHEVTGVKTWSVEEYAAAFAATGWRVAEHHDADHAVFETWILER
ncbi:hypothetical protein RM780_24780 [Streptomyces sp. DSM 44917]|uniref:Methyltransferase n=1 Tax=Streptomyces boetiae TaxID=3075541 RepID=A0ABU2LEY8_9ACTN|nr:hypothetical protein [Streptomyces sp. DSM 44917]MDT0310145.1 hypothetical protein [Streptomyces sp. DSM 44917]